MLDWRLRKGAKMVRKSYTPEQIINKLREAEILLSQGATLGVILKKISVSDCTYYRWRKEYWRHEGGTGEASQGVRTGELPLEATSS